MEGFNFTIPWIEKLIVNKAKWLIFVATDSDRQASTLLQFWCCPHGLATISILLSIKKPAKLTIDLSV